jgi:hypothetical protein
MAGRPRALSTEAVLELMHFSTAIAHPPTHPTRPHPPRVHTSPSIAWPSAGTLTGCPGTAAPPLHPEDHPAAARTAGPAFHGGKEGGARVGMQIVDQRLLAGTDTYKSLPQLVQRARMWRQAHATSPAA